MSQRHQHPDAGTQAAGTDGSAWLSTLIDTFERTAQLENVPCDTKALSAAKARLQRPAILRPRPVLRRRQATLLFQH
ncbi:hypothetical protein AB7813_06350 [Tardiphaga sp. 20_F10_N6_6]|jgi:hypothetical protein|uniref:Uncharacterized protein n=1 Tax=Tardiphaga robiniae TaxID=943830 RepID=A0A7G6TSR0_9BRAD|nr:MULTISPECIES: hypothetical protein [Tardiphaga]QND69792.1 hypothetical protein HB776_10365 [Tardiphaga robiniae]SEH96965.1 hypothetical protein SAMN05216367_2600 [Tardiphaga sp. OK245]